MAGTRQHFIPRMLLRYFADTREQVRVLHRNGHSFVTTIRNIALENEFYGKSGPDSADEAITQEEFRIGPMLQLVNAAPEGTIDNTIAAELITHFTVRVRGMRTFMSQAAHVAIDEINRQFSDSDSIRSTMSSYIQNNPGIIIEELHNKVREQYGSTALTQLLQHPQYPIFLELLFKSAQQMIGNLDAAAVTTDIQKTLAYFQSKISEVAKQSHEKAILSGPTPKQRTEILAGFTFATQNSTHDLILGDSVGWGLRSSVGITPLYSLEDDLQMIAMPISRTRTLVGWRNERPDLSSEVISKASAYTCEDFVIAHPDVADLAQFRDEFGKGRAVALATLAAEASKSNS